MRWIARWIFSKKSASLLIHVNTGHISYGRHHSFWATTSIGIVLKLSARHQIADNSERGVLDRPLTGAQSDRGTSSYAGSFLIAESEVSRQTDGNRTNPRRSIQSLFDPAIMLPRWGSFRKLDPKRMISNPVMFVVEIVSLFVTILFLRDFVNRGADMKFTFQIMAWLWSPCSLRISPRRWPKAAARRQAATLRKARIDTQAKRLASAQATRTSRFRRGLTQAISFLSRQGILSERWRDHRSVASVDESAITGESAPVIARAAAIAPL